MSTEESGAVELKKLLKADIKRAQDLAAEFKDLDEQLAKYKTKLRSGGLRENAGPGAEGVKNMTFTIPSGQLSPDAVRLPSWFKRQARHLIEFSRRAGLLIAAPAVLKTNPIASNSTFPSKANLEAVGNVIYEKQDE